MASIIVRPRARVFHGHDWVHDNEVLKVTGAPVDGDVIGLKDQRDRFLGSAIYNSRSKIPARRFSRQRQDLDADFFLRRLKMASEYRDKLGLDPRARREVWSESDGLPGLILDRYDDCAVLQTLTLSMDQRKELIADAVMEVLSPRSLIERNDAPVRRAEGMESAVGVLRGETPSPMEVELGGVRFGIELPAGQKTGLYLDQGDNYALVAARARGLRVLDCFSNQGGFALACAQAGATEVTAIDVSADACTAIEANTRLNGVTIKTIEANVFDWLKSSSRQGDEYDLIILDPPSFTRDRARLNDAMRGYKEIHLRAAAMLGNGGLLATFCCSHHVSPDAFREVITEAMVDAKRTARVREHYFQRADHPVIAGLPESEYLKGFLLEMAPGR
ncbi:MAG: class I SAM-dependent rRNA methyltransferase [Chthoniobacterales bacterium]|jgi:23S rRNA (cytosine1962-C5)-methyltransferase